MSSLATSPSTRIRGFRMCNIQGTGTSSVERCPVRMGCSVKPLFDERLHLRAYAVPVSELAYLPLLWDMSFGFLMLDCICRKTGSTDPELQAFWRVDNSLGSFFTQHSLASMDKCKPFELRQVILDHGCYSGQLNEAELSSQEPAARTGEGQRALTATPSGRIYDHVARFKLVWWDKGSGSAKNVSIWRPIAPSGCAILGDMAVEG